MGEQVAEGLPAGNDCAEPRSRGGSWPGGFRKVGKRIAGKRVTHVKTHTKESASSLSGSPKIIEQMRPEEMDPGASA